MAKAFLFVSVAAIALVGCSEQTAEKAQNTVRDDMAMVANDDVGANAAAVDNLAAGNATGQQSAIDFVNAVAATDAFQLESARFAIVRAKKGAVRDFAKMLIADHEKSTADLKAATAKIEPPITPAPTMSAEQRADIGALQRAKIDDFDKLYVSKQIAVHEKALGLLRGYAASGDVAALKAFASATAAVVAKHLKAARALAV